MTCVENTPHSNDGQPQPPAIARRREKIGRKMVDVVLPQFYPDQHRGQSYDFAELVLRGVIKPDLSDNPATYQRETESAPVASEAAAIALRNHAEQLHRDEQQPPAHN